MNLRQLHAILAHRLKPRMSFNAYWPCNVGKVQWAKSDRASEETGYICPPLTNTTLWLVSKTPTAAEMVQLEPDWQRNWLFWQTRDLRTAKCFVKGRLSKCSPSVHISHKPPIQTLFSGKHKAVISRENVVKWKKRPTLTLRKSVIFRLSIGFKFVSITFSHFGLALKGKQRESWWVERWIQREQMVGMSLDGIRVCSGARGDAKLLKGHNGQTHFDLSNKI